MHAKFFTHSKFSHAANCYSHVFLHTEVFKQKKNTQGYLYTAKPLHTASFYTQKIYTERPLNSKVSKHSKFSHKEVPTQKRFYTEKLLHTDFFYTQKLLHRETFTQFLRTEVFTQQACTQRSSCTERFLHSKVFTHSKLSHRESFTHRSFYKQ